MAARTLVDTSSALAPGDCMMPMPTACLLSSSERRPYSWASSSTRATSDRCVTAPSGEVFRMMSRNSSSVCRRPRAFTFSCSGTSPSVGEAPITPAATCTFCSRMALTTSPAVMPRWATFCGSSQTRIE